MYVLGGFGKFDSVCCECIGVAFTAGPIIGCTCLNLGQKEDWWSLSTVHCIFCVEDRSVGSEAIGKGIG